MTSLFPHLPTWMRRVGSLVFATVLIGGWTTSSLAQTLIAIRSDGSPLTAVPMREVGDTAYITASDARQLLDGDGFPVQARYRYVAPTRTVTIRLESDGDSLLIKLSGGDPQVVISGRPPFVLSDPPMAGEGDLWLPMEFLTALIPLLVPVSVEYNPSETRLVVGPPTDEPSVEADVGPAVPAPPPATPRADAGSTYYSTRPKPADWTGLVVVIDPGHGGTDLGVQANGLIEKDVALQVAREIVTIAQGVHGRAFLTRVRDENMSLQDRAKVTTTRNATAYVSLHFNSSLASTNGGYRLVVNSSEGAIGDQSDASIATNGESLSKSRRLADALDNALHNAGFSGDRMELPIATVPDIPIAAVHLELAYASNGVETALWSDARTRRSAAEAIWSGLAQYRP